ncbi:hypothetical protein [Pseudomonas sp. Irchel 3E20]|uniref:hypothetical protein n=1 Tax=Pseudomonas sp. Irchel 3E20 TaxID=2008983 RepID=UPI0021151C5C|nr:hypothetical protein [Pseudomonas sp. Irchel 3E20]
MNFQPPDPERFGSCLKCSSLIEESEQSGGICFECHAVDAGKEPAFPVGANEYGGHDTCFGMTVRDYFAVKALQGMISTAGAPCLFGLEGGEHDTAKAAYKIADAMLAARSA